eukprot:388540-Rhodomonas_salina.2
MVLLLYYSFYYIGMHTEVAKPQLFQQVFGIFPVIATGVHQCPPFDAPASITYRALKRELPISTQSHPKFAVRLSP